MKKEIIFFIPVEVNEFVMCVLMVNLIGAES